MISVTNASNLALEGRVEENPELKVIFPCVANLRPALATRDPTLKNQPWEGDSLMDRNACCTSMKIWARIPSVLVKSWTGHGLKKDVALLCRWGRDRRVPGAF